MNLDGELVRLRTFTLEDIPAILAMSQEDCARKWLPSQVCAGATHAAELTHWLIQQFDLRATPISNAFVFGVEEKVSGRLIGHVGLSPLFGSVEVGFGIATAAQGKGYATQAVVTACKWAFSQFSLPAILGVTDCENAASQRVLVRSRFRKKEERSMCMQGVERPVVIFELKPGHLDQSGARK